MKKIGIDCRLINQTGIGCYLRNLLHFVPEESNFIFYLYLLKKDFPLINFPQKNFIKKEANFLWHSLSEQIGFLKTILADSLDLFHFTYFSYPILYPKKFIATIHDLTPVIFKTGKASTKNIFIYKIKHFFFRQLLSNQIKKARVIITPTKTVKKQILKYHPQIFAKKIIPIYEGVNYELIKAKENAFLQKKYSQPFFIYVGNFYPHKNLDNLIKAFKKINSKNKLILIGPDDFFSEKIIQLINKLNLKKKIFLFKNPTINDLVFFYKKALALIHPSLSEGFGLPLIEAAYFNCPIIASDIPVFNEILEDNYLKFNPKNPIDIAKKITLFLKKKPKYDYSQILKKYSFEKMTQKTIKIYQKLLDE